MQIEKFPSIEQFRNVVKRVTDVARFDGLDERGEAKFVNRPLPVVAFTGTVKLHGTNAGIQYDKENDRVIYQSRERFLDLTHDNAGFMLWASQDEAFWKATLIQLAPAADKVIVYGEWCGGNIQKGVALSQLEKMFVIFAAKAIVGETEIWLPLQALDLVTLPEQTYSINEFPSYFLCIDFENPHVAQDQMVRLVEQVEAECPVGKHFGVSGIGEGIVWTAQFMNQFFMFKTKGEKHSNSKVTKVASVDVDKINSVKAFVESVVSEPRLKQGLDYFREMGIEAVDRNVGQFIQWVNKDVFKEEHDTIIENQLDAKMVAKEASNISRKWYFAQI